ncbi:MAG: hypothetical protein KAS32_17365 [Candidatus Peribacteraceae bacterium]|nr:hypothetical protein [Candidatus Peribacteraceae bacterium]
MERKLLITLIAVLVVLVIILFPRECGTWGTLARGAEYKECNCIGLKLRSFTIGGGPVTCYGIPTSDYCYKLDDVDGNTQKIDILCE